MAAATIAATLGFPVEQHDDGRRPGMHDLNIVGAGGRHAAVEVTAAADADSIELWKLVNGSGKRWLVPSLRGGWMLHLEPTARAKRLLRELPAFLLELETRGVVHIDRRGRHEARGSVEHRARLLGITVGDQSATDFPGSIYLTIDRPSERTGGIVDNTGSAVSNWVPRFLMDAQQRDVLTKLARSGAAERHAFIIVPAFSTAPFGVVDMLWRSQEDVVPQEAPILPSEVTHIWLSSLWTLGSGLRWSPESGWQRFERHFDVTL